MTSSARRGKHRAPSSAPRNSAAALMIGGLVAGTVATATAGTFSQQPSDDDSLAAGLGNDLADVVRGATSEARAAEKAPGQPEEAPESPEAASLGSASLSELRDQRAADRSEARSAPDDAASVQTLLGTSEFTGQTVQVEQPVEEAAPVQAATVQAVQEAEPAPEPAPEPTPEPAPAPEPPAAPAPVGGSVLDIAAAYVGYPYVLYGTPPNSFDCSSYTWYVFQQAGIDIPRTVAGQKGAVTPVSDPQPGDLVFYNDYYHVGIYAGGGMTYEALNASTGVRYGPLISSNVWYGRIG